MLLNFGIVSKKRQRYNKQYRSFYHYLSITGQVDKQHFAHKIGFTSQRKQQKLLKHLKTLRLSATNVDSIPHLNQRLAKLFLKFKQKIRMTNRLDWKLLYDYLPEMAKKPSLLTYPRLEKILRAFRKGAQLPEYKAIKSLFDRQLFWDPVVNIKPSLAHVFDFTVPKNATFFANGFLNHNTTLCLHVIAQAQKRGGMAAFIDAEHALDVNRAKIIGVNVEDLYLSQPDTGEQALEIAETLIRSGAFDVIVVDSVAALVPKAEIEGEMGDSMMGVQARLMSQAMRKLTAAISRSKTTMIFTNQLRMKIGVVFGNPEVTTGGMALKFYASIRLDVRKVGKIEEGEEIIGSRHRARVVKNKVAPPFQETEFDVMNVGGISHVGGLLDVGEKYGLIDKSGAFLKFAGEILGQGREAAKMTLEENHALAEKIERAIWAKEKGA